MRKRIISAIVSIAMLASLMGAFTIPASAAGARSYTRKVEYLTRGVVAIKMDGGVYLSWRLLGTEQLTQKFDIYRDGVKIVSDLDATNYNDNGGFAYNKYQVVPAGTAEAQVDYECDKTEVWSNNYIDIPLDKPAGGVTKAGESYTYSVNDTSVADVDGDGEYEYIIKWDPSNSKDNSQHGQTGNVLLDCYKLDGTKLWRIDLGINIRAGAHYTQFIAYDFDGDGKAEVAMRTAPGSKDSTGGYVSRVGAAPLLGTGVAADPFTWKDASTGKTYTDTSDMRQTGTKSGHIIQGPDWLTMFNGETGVAMQTVNYPVQRGSVKSWGDSYGGRSERNVAGMAYLDGVHPSLIMCRGYYARATMGAYNWDGTNFTKLWVRDDKSDNKNTLFTNGNHQLSVADLDNDGKDEVTIGSAAADDDGSMLHSTGHGHGDALHVSDFNNDGAQEIFTVHEEKTYYKTWGAELRRGSNPDGSGYFGDSIGSNILAYTPANGDNGRGVMANIDDDFAYGNGFHSYYWSVADGNLYKDNGSGKGSPVTITSTVDGKEVTTNVSQPSSCNSLIYWDGDLSRELLDRNRIDKFSVTNGQSRLATFDNVHSDNGSKANAALSGDFFGDWREEVAFGTGDDTALRIFTTTIPTDYKLTTLMHDTQYRCAIAWQNVGYNQPPHPSYYIGKDALKSGANYLEPAAGFDKVEFAHTPTKTISTPDEEISLMSSSQSFDSDSWGIGTRSTTDAPYNSIVTTSSGTTTKDLDLKLTSDEVSYVKLTSFTLNNDNTATAVINNGTDSYFSAKLYTASYTAGNVLSDVTLSNITVAGGKTETVTSTAPAVPQGGSVKAFLWDANDKPYTAPLTSTNKTVTNVTLKEDNGKVETLDFALDWKPGTSSASSVAIQSDSGANMVSLSKSSGAAMQYAAGNTSAKTVNSTLTSNASWYHINVTMDLTSKTADISVLDYTTPNATEKIVYAASFANVDGDPSKLAVTGVSSLDNVTVSSVKYNVPRSLLNFTVKNSSGAAVSDAKVAIGGTTLTTDESGKAAIKVKNGEYSYAVSKTANKTAKGTVNADGTQDINATLVAGDQRNVSIKYMFDNAMDITEAVKGEGVTSVQVGTATENTSYTIPDSAKADINGYRFSDDPEDVAPGYEDYAGQTVNLEFDPDKSDVTNVNVAEGADTVIALSYKIKRVPSDTDTELARIQYGEGGIGSNGTGTNATWSVTGNAYEQMSDSGKYIRIGNFGTSTLTVNIPNASSKMVMEFDMKYEDMPWGGNFFGVTPYSDSAVGQWIAMRTSGESNGQWQLYFGRNANTDFFPKTDQCSDKSYTYAYNWRNQWMHIVLVSDGSGKLYVTQANKETGIVYVQDQSVTMQNSVGTTTKPINKLVFGRTYGSGDAIIGFKNFKAYTVGAASEMRVTERQIDVPSRNVFTATADHPSDMEGVTYDASAFLGEVTYELRNSDGTVVSSMPTGMTLTDDGVLTTTADFDTSVPYRLVVNIGGQPAYAYDLTYRTKTLTTKMYQGFDGGANDTGNCTITSKSGYTLSNSSGSLKYSRTAGTARDGGVQITMPVTSEALADEYYYIMDFKVVSAAFKGYLYLKNGASGDEYTRAETHLYEPRIKFFTDTDYSANATFGSSIFSKNEWYTLVYHGTDMSSASRNIELKIYKTSELDAAGYTATNNRDYSNVTDVTPVLTTNITPKAADTSSGMCMVWQVGQGDGTASKGAGVENADEWYFDNIYYQYYAFN